MQHWTKIITLTNPVFSVYRTMMLETYDEVGRKTVDVSFAHDQAVIESTKCESGNS